MLVYLVFEHDWEGLEFRGAYDNFDAAIDHAKAIHRFADAEIHEFPLCGAFVEGDFNLKSNVSGHQVVWTSLDQSGAI